MIRNRLTDTSISIRKRMRSAVRLNCTQLEDRTAPATFTVTSTADTLTPGTLRQAITDLNLSTAPTNTINITATGTISLLSNLPTISKAVSIVGPGASNLTIQRDSSAPNFRIITLSGTFERSISGVTLSGGKVTGNGGALYSTGTLTLDRVVITNNTANGGGAIAISGGAFRLLNSTISGNSAIGTGGFNGGGAIYNFPAANVLIENSTISGNTSAGPQGAGGIYLYGTPPAAPPPGFGFLPNTNIIRNSTISGNKATNTAAGAGGGGIAFQSSGGTLLIENSTITGNETAGGKGGGGIARTGGSAVITVTSSIVAGNMGGASPEISSTGTVNANNSAFVSTAGFTPTGTGNKVDTLANLKIDTTLANNGGPTLTHKLLTGSPLIDAGSNPSALPTDQRGTGFARVFGTATDIGSFEVQPVGIPFVLAIGAPTVTIANVGETTYTFTVTYKDTDNLINFSTLNTGDITVTGPNLFSQVATFVSASPSMNAGTIVATYKLDPTPGGSWDAIDSGTYTISVNANQVFDTNTTPNPVPAGAVGTFTVSIPNFTVLNANDSGFGSLRQTIADANANPGLDTITFDPTFFSTAKTINLTTGHLTITDSVTINGPAVGVTIAGAAAASATNRIFNINGPGVFTVTLNDMTLTSGNVTGRGGAIYIFDEVLNLNRVTITNNKASSTGGGINIQSVGVLNTSETTISGNTATSNGGGIYFFSGGGASIQRTTVSGNTTAGGAGGGGMYFFGTVAASGLKIINSTFSGNKATAGPGGGLVLRSLTGKAEVFNSTFIGNEATLGGGIARPTGTGEINVTSSIIAGNTGGTDPEISSTGTVNANNSAFVSTAGFTPTGSGNKIDTLANLKIDTTLANNGGLTLTHKLLTGSPLFDAGSNPLGLVTDQIGGARVAGAAADIGAVEADTTPPTLVNITSTTANGIYGVGSMINVTVTFSEAVNSTGTLTVTLDTGDTVVFGPFTNKSSLSGTFTVTAGKNSPDLTAVSPLTLVGGSIADLAGNPLGSLAIPAGQNLGDLKNIVIDGVAPTITSITSTTPDGFYNAGKTINVTVNFSEPVTIAGGPLTVNLNSGGSLTIAPGTGSSLSGTYTVMAGQNAADLTVTGFMLGSATVQDAAANNASLTIPGGQNLGDSKNIVIDTIAPTVTINQSVSQVDPTGSGPILFTVVFSEPVIGFTMADVSLAGTTATGTLSITVTESGPMNGTTFTVAVDGMTGGGVVVASVPGGGATDKAGNGNSASTSTDNTVTFDPDIPTPVITQNASTMDPTNANSIVFDVTFNVPVTGLTSSDVDFTGSTVSGTLVATIAGIGSSYTITVTGMTPGTQGDVVISLPAGAVVNAMLSPSTPSVNVDNKVTFDQVAPTATISKDVGQADPASVAPVLFTVVFNEPINLATFSGSDISFTGSTVGGTLVATVSETGPMNGTTFTVSVTGMSGTGTVVANLIPGSVTDLAGNALGIVTPINNSVNFDNGIPSVLISSTTTNPTTATIIPITITFSEPVTGFVVSDVVLSKGSIINFSGSGAVYTFDLVTVGDGPYTVNVPAGVAVDSASNPNTAAPTFIRTVDNSAPTVAINSTAGPTVGNVTQFIDIVFSEPVAGFDASKLTLTNATVVGLGGNGTVFQLLLRPIASGPFGFSIAAGAVTDLAGNFLANGATFDRIADVDGPVATFTTTVMGDPVRMLSIPVTLSFNEPIFGFTADDLFAVNALISNFTGSGTTFTFTMTALTQGTASVSLRAGAVNDAVGNLNNEVTFSRSFQTTAPTTIISLALGQLVRVPSGPVNFLVQFSSAVTGFTASDVLVSGTAGGRVTAVTPMGNGFVVTVDGFGRDGTVRIDIPANIATDAAGNGNQAGDGSGAIVNIGSLAAAPKQIYAVGAGAGSAPIVSVYDSATGALKFTIMAFDPSFTGGVTVATGDVNNDGFADVIVGAGFGGGPIVRTFDGRTGQPIATYLAYEASFRGGVSVAFGDVNGDGFGDILVGAGVGGGPRVRAFDGRSGGELLNFFPYEPDFRGGITVAAADFNDDGRDDVVVGSGVGGGPRVSVFDANTGRIIRDFLTEDGDFRGGIFVAAGDFDGDGVNDIISGAGRNGSGLARVVNGNSLKEMFTFPVPNAEAGGVRVALIDLGADGTAELLASTADSNELNFFGPNGQIRRTVAQGSDFMGGVFVG